MKKIMFYIGSMQLGGAQRVVANLINYFINQNYCMVLINDIVPQNNKKEYEIDSRVMRYFVENKKKNFIIKNLSRIIEIRNIVKKEKPDVIISFMASPNIRTIFATIGLKTKKIISVRNDPNVEYGTGLKKIISNIILRKTDGCVFQTDDAKKYFCKKIQKNSTIIFNPVNPIFYETNKSGIGKDIITIGRLEKQKNHKLLIDAYIKISDKLRNDKLIIYGEGSLRKELENYIIKNNMKSKILMPGLIDDPYNKLSMAKLFVLSSDYEGMPNALMEAMAVGVPVISTNCPCGGPKDLIVNEKQGILIKCGDVDELSKNIIKIINDKTTLKNMSEEAKTRAQDFKSINIFVEWEKYINSFIK